MRLKYDEHRKEYKKEIIEIIKSDSSEISQIIGKYLELSRYNPIDDRMEIPLHMIKDADLRFIRMNLVAGQLINDQVQAKIGEKFLALWIE